MDVIPYDLTQKIKQIDTSTIYTSVASNAIINASYFCTKSSVGVVFIGFSTIYGSVDVMIYLGDIPVCFSNVRYDAS